MAATAFAIEQSRRAEARHLPGPCHDDFLRLSRTLIHGPEFQWLLVEAPNEGLRRQVMTALDNVLQLAGLSSNRLPLSAKILDVPMLEERLVKIARSAAVVHVLGQSGWFDAARWEAFNIRRERLASKARSKLVFWLDAEAIALASRCAPDLWSWRGGVYSFVPEAVSVAALPSAPSSGDITIDARIDRDKAFRSSPNATDTRTMAERSRRVVEIKAWLAHHPESPDVLKVSPIDELGRLLFSLGDYDDALEHWQHIELLIFHRLNDSRAATITHGFIADILQQRGDSEEALRIYREEQLPVYERLGEVRSRAITMGKIADILHQRGDSEEALRILRLEVFPAFERLGDARLRAITIGQIADILKQRGDSEEALRIYREEELPVYKRLGDVHSRAVTMGKIADILQQRGNSEVALRIRREEELPVYEQLGNVREWALTMGKIAEILQQRGNNEEALRILSEEVLPAAERPEDMAPLANTLYKCATVRLNCGGLENKVDAQRIAEELKRSFDLSCQIQHVDGIACVGSLFGQLLAKSGFMNEALAVLEKAAAAFEVLQELDQAAKLRELVDKLQKSGDN